MLFFVALTLMAVVHGWVSMSVDINKCTVRPGRVYTGKQLRRKCPDAFKCTTGQTIKSGESIKNYEQCYEFSCNCGSTGKDYSLNTWGCDQRHFTHSTNLEKDEMFLVEKSNDKRRAIIEIKCYGYFHQLGMSCNYRLPPGCHENVSRCGENFTFTDDNGEECSPLGASCVG